MGAEKKLLAGTLSADTTMKGLVKVGRCHVLVTERAAARHDSGSLSRQCPGGREYLN